MTKDMSSIIGFLQARISIAKIALDAHVNVLEDPEVADFVRRLKLQKVLNKLSVDDRTLTTVNYTSSQLRCKNLIDLAGSLEKTLIDSDKMWKNIFIDN
jgi:hypothetical protein